VSVPSCLKNASHESVIRERCFAYIWPEVYPMVVPRPWIRVRISTQRKIFPPIASLFPEGSEKLLPTGGRGLAPTDPLVTTINGLFRKIECRMSPLFPSRESNECVGLKAQVDFRYLTCSCIHKRTYAPPPSRRSFDHYKFFATF